MEELVFDGAETEHCKYWFYNGVCGLKLNCCPGVTLSEVLQLVGRLKSVHIGLVEVIKVFDLLN